MDPLDLSIDIVTTILAFGAGFYAFRIRSTFRGGLLWRGWQTIGPSAFLYAFAVVVNILADILENSFLTLLQSILELLFALALAYGFYLFQKAWTPKAPTKE
jgi:hypothetical protein